MSSNIADLHKILKDETRRKAIILLHERGNLSYVDLMKALGIANTGKMNYHLKILGDLLTKTEEGKYALTEKGKLASRLLVEFPERKSQTQNETELPRWLYVAGYLFAFVFLIGNVAAYVRGVINYSSMMINTLIAISTLMVFVVSSQVRKLKAKWPSKRQILWTEIYFIIFGALTGIAVFLIGGSFLLFAFETLLQSAGVQFVLFPFAWWVIVSFVFGPLIGGCVGYLLFKRSRYAKARY